MEGKFVAVEEPSKEDGPRGKLHCGHHLNVVECGARAKPTGAINAADKRGVRARHQSVKTSCTLATVCPTKVKRRRCLHRERRKGGQQNVKEQT